MPTLPNSMFQRYGTLISFVVAFTAFLCVVFTLGTYGHTWDEALYYQGSIACVKWLQKIFSSDCVQALTHPQLYWGTVFDGNDPLHPEVAPIPKLISGLGSMFAFRAQDTMLCMRLPIAVFFSLTVFLVTRYGIRYYGSPMAGLFYLFMPRVFGHAHLAASETLSAFAAVLLFLFLVDFHIRNPWKFSVSLAALFALMFLTKITLVIFTIPALVWVYFHRKDITARHYVFVIILTAGLSYALWPTFWSNPIGRFWDYLQFYASHQKTTVFYLSQKWGYVFGRPAPWHYPFVLCVVTIPVMTLFFTLMGIVSVLRKRFADISAGLCLVFAFLPILPTLLPGAPKYDGERLFFCSFVFFAILAGGPGWQYVLSWIRRKVPNKRIFVGLIATVCGGISINGFFQICTDSPYQLDFYNCLAGGHKGARTKGFETTYWGQSFNVEVCDWMNRNLPNNASVYPLALENLALLHMQDWGYLRSDFSIGEPKGQRYFILQVREGFLGQMEQKLFFSKCAVFEQKSGDGTVFLAIYPG